MTGDRMADRKTTLPPRDSWVTIAPGATVRIDPRLKQEWSRLTDECRQIRGTVLAKAFEIEYLLDQLIVETLMPSSQPEPAERAVFDELFLKGPSFSFRLKTDVLRKLRVSIPRLREVLPHTVLGHLAKVRQIRNDFAHYPVTFEPVGEPPNQVLHPLLVSRRGSFPLDGPLLKEYGEAAQAAFSAMENALKVLKPNASESGERA